MQDIKIVWRKEEDFEKIEIFYETKNDETKISVDGMKAGNLFIPINGFSGLWIHIFFD